VLKVVALLMEFHHLEGLSCEDFEEELLALLAAIEACHPNQVLTSCSKAGVKGSRELIRPSFHINYDANSSSASRGRVKGRVVGGYYEAQAAFMECKSVK
jgi:hypothetical protein